MPEEIATAAQAVKPVTRTFTRAWLINSVMPWSPACVSVSNKIVDTTRWHVVHEVVFAFEGKHYRTRYRAAATEHQEDDLWDNQETVVCEAVEQRPVLELHWFGVIETSMHSTGTWEAGPLTVDELPALRNGDEIIYHEGDFSVPGRIIGPDPFEADGLLVTFLTGTCHRIDANNCAEYLPYGSTKDRLRLSAKSVIADVNRGLDRIAADIAARRSVEPEGA